MNGGRYSLKSTPEASLQAAWVMDVAGINPTIDVYGTGNPPDDPNIDPTSFDARQKSYSFFLSHTKETAVAALKQQSSYFDGILTMAMHLL